MKMKKIDCSKAIRDLKHDPKIPRRRGFEGGGMDEKHISQGGVNKYDGDSGNRLYSGRCREGFKDIKRSTGTLFFIKETCAKEIKT